MEYLRQEVTYNIHIVNNPKLRKQLTDFRRK